MKVFNCILGIFAIFGSIYCMFFPGATFLSSGWIVAILLGMLGVCSIFEYAANRKKAEKSNTKLVASGVVGLVFGIIAAVLSLLALFFPQVRGILDITILLMFVLWLVYSGVAGIFGAIAQKKLTERKMWVFTLVMSILLVLTGLYAATHLLYAAFAIGFMVGIELMVYGIRLLLSVFEKE
ncbi:MAG: DUF308 domain-containing protein [Clostridia bacterium]|nr:DUF308 domain-containing protein [Clostridia bacterium]